MSDQPPYQAPGPQPGYPPAGQPGVPVQGTPPPSGYPPGPGSSPATSRAGISRAGTSRAGTQAGRAGRWLSAGRPATGIPATGGAPPGYPRLRWPAGAAAEKVPYRALGGPGHLGRVPDRRRGGSRRRGPAEAAAERRDAVDPADRRGVDDVDRHDLQTRGRADERPAPAGVWRGPPVRSPPSTRTRATRRSSSC